MFVPLQPNQDAAVIISRLDDAQCEELMRNCVHAIIILGQDRSPIKKLELNKLAFPTSNYRVAAAIIQLANKELYTTFGMRLYELEDKSKYLLVNTKTRFADHITYSDAMCNELAVLYFVLMDIFVSPDERMTEEEIENSLKPLDHPRDTIKSYLDSFVKRLYLNQDKRHETKMFSWGPRAIAEVEPDSFLGCFLKLIGEDSDKDWPDLKKRIDKLKSVPNR